MFGSLGPDLGYFPGGDKLLADLAHCVRPADLVRSLIASSTSGTELAFAWGWATHMLADIWIHPLINEAVGELVHGRRLPAVSYADNPTCHVRVESGLDATLPARNDWARPPRFTRKIGILAATPIATAYGNTYGFFPSKPQLERTLRFAGGFISLVLLNGSVFSGRPSNLFARTTVCAMASLTRHFRPRGILAALTNPLLPPCWLICRASEVVDQFPGRFEPYCASNFADLPNINLDTGHTEGDIPDYAVTVAAIEELNRRNAALPSK
jgi:hypothetical protein